MYLDLNFSFLMRRLIFYYKKGKNDSVFFPQASELDGEIDLSTCYDVKEFPVQRNYGFQILVSDNGSHHILLHHLSTVKKSLIIYTCLKATFSDQVVPK